MVKVAILVKEGTDMQKPYIPVTRYTGTSCGLSFRLVTDSHFNYVEMVDHVNQKTYPAQPIEKPYTLSYERVSFQRRFAQVVRFF